MCIKHLAVALFAAGISLTGSNTLYAQVFKKVMPDGSVVFTDEPTEGAQQIEVTPLPTTTFPGGKTKSESTTKAAPGKAAEPAPPSKSGITSFSITSPAQDSPVRANNGAVAVSLSVVPGLDPKQGHVVTLLLDGKAAAAPAAQTSFTLEGVERGSHTLSAEIRDGAGRVVATASPVIFHLQRTSAPR